MDNIIQTVKDFLSTGYNLYIVIGAAALLVLIIVIAAVAGSRAKKKKKAIAEETYVEPKLVAADAPSTVDVDSIDVDAIDVKAEPEIHNNGAVIIKSPAKSGANTTSVIMTPVKDKPKPQKKVVVVSAPAEKESSFGKDYIYNPESAKRPGTVQIYKDNGDKYRFRFKSSNAETVGHSQGYTTKGACKNGIKAVIHACTIAEVADTTREDYVVTIGKAVFEIYRDNEKKFRFRLTAANATNVLASQGYTSKANCINGIESIRNIAAFHVDVDDTLVKKQPQ